MKTTVQLESRLANRWAQRFSKQKIANAARMLAPTLIAVSFASAAHAQGTMDFSGAQTLMGTFNAYVFDVLQTDGTELPTMREIHGTVGENRDRILAFIKRQGIELSLPRRSPDTRHQLRRTHCHSPRTDRSRGVFNPCPRTRARDAA